MKKTILLFLLLTVLTVSIFAGNTGQPDAMLLVGEVSPAEPTAAAALCFSDVPKNLCGSYLLRWYRDGVPITEAVPFSLYENACAVCRSSYCFSESMPQSSTLSAVLSDRHKSYTYSAEVAIRNYDRSFYERLAGLKYPYRIDVLRFQNVVLVWAQDENGSYSILQNAFACSTGKATPRGSFHTGEKLRWHLLYGSEETNWNYVYGQYITRITRSILFHSVPYYSRSQADLESAQFNLLGARASQGCIRLSVENAKWIYDHIPDGTQVDFIDELPLPCALPVSPKIDLDDPRCGWDPTDPHPMNPWQEVELRG